VEVVSETDTVVTADDNTDYIDTTAHMHAARDTTAHMHAARDTTAALNTASRKQVEGWKAVEPSVVTCLQNWFV